MANLFSGKREVYLQIAERFANFIRIGVLKDGDKLPSVRVAAGEMGVNPNTVQKAYSHLEEQGLICSLPKKGVFVTVKASPAEVASSRDKAVYEAISKLKENGISRESIEKVLKEVYYDD